jgi:hypothetical protein
MSIILRDEVPLQAVYAAAEAAGGTLTHDIPRSHWATRKLRWSLPDGGELLYVENHVLGARGFLGASPELPSDDAPALLDLLASPDRLTRLRALRGLAFLCRGQWDPAIWPLVQADVLHADPRVHQPALNALAIAEWAPVEGLLRLHLADAPWVLRTLERFYGEGAGEE